MPVAPPVPASTLVAPPASADHLRGVGFMLLGSLGFSLMSLCVKVASATLPTMEIVFVRSAMMTLLAAGFIHRTGGSFLGHDRRTLRTRALVGATALSLLYFGLGRLPLGDAVTIQYTAPVWTALSAALLLGERLRPAVLAGVAVCLAGVVLVAQPTVLFGASPDPLDLLGVVAVACGAFLSGLSHTFVRKLSQSDGPHTIIFYLSWVGMVGALPFAFVGDGWAWPSAAGWALLLAIGATTQVGQLGLTLGLQRLEAGAATAIGYVQIVLAFVWGLVFFDDVPDALSLVGAAVVISSVVLLARRAE